MGSIFRSEKMSLCQIFLQPEAAYTTVADLGESGSVQFRDLNSDVNNFQRTFVAEVRRCDELERKVHYVESELQKDGYKMPDIIGDSPKAPNPKEIGELEAQLERAEVEIQELSKNSVNLKTNYLELTELLSVLERADVFFADQEVIDMDEGKHSAAAGQDRGCLGFVAGVINRERSYAFERMLWRISRGNIYLKRSELEEPLVDPATGNLMYKTVFVVFFQGEQLKGRVKKVCTGFRASTYPCSSSHSERMDTMKGVRTRVEDLKRVISQSEDHRNAVLHALKKELPIWQVKIIKMKAIYHVLNMFSKDVSSKCLIGECWVPTVDMDRVQSILSEAAAAAGSPVPSFLNIMKANEEPPTYFRTNKFTRGFQNLIDAYGVASYREVNPALYTCITFPFLYAVMFGDLGHGFVLLLFGAWMCIWEESLGKTKGGEIWRIFFAGRYIILLMGIFACYTGLVYNEVFSKSVNIFGSKWRVHYNTSTVMTNPTGLQLDPKYTTTGVYAYGTDPIWEMADNKIIFTNTYKMKLSIIFGVLHMIFGVCMSVANFVYFKRYAFIILEFVPQLLFLCLFFGYMAFMMFYKFVKYSPTTDFQPDTPGCAPSVLIMFINMMLFKDQPPLPGCDEYMFTVQPTLQKVFVIVALICIPWMLLGKPLYINFQRKSKLDGKSDRDVFVEDAQVENPIGEEYSKAHEDEEPMSEVWIHQAIHTIEYVLSTISHTASYLRLWALSLAHSQLSQVLWTMVLSEGLQIQGYVGCIAIFFIFAIWMVLTIAIMIMMEGLSAFLHTLRLHWVEFMSKFYVGAGYLFQPFSFKTILDADEDE